MTEDGLGIGRQQVLDEFLDGDGFYGADVVEGGAGKVAVFILEEVDSLGEASFEGKHV